MEEVRGLIAGDLGDLIGIGLVEDNSFFPSPAADNGTAANLRGEKSSLKSARSFSLPLLSDLGRRRGEIEPELSAMSCKRAIAGVSGEEFIE